MKEKKFYIEEKTFIKIIKSKINFEISPLERKLISQFFKNKTTKKLLKSSHNYHYFSKTYELYIAWLFNDRCNNFDDYLLKTENNSKPNQANDGIDIIYPYQKTLYAIQVKTSKLKEPNPAKLEKRGKEFIKELQKIDNSPKSISSKWKISEKVVQVMKVNKDSYELKTIWISPNGSIKKDKILNYKTVHWSIFQILTIRYFKNPDSINIPKKYEFTITSEFSEGSHKAIIEKRNDKIYSLVVPLQITQLYDFFKDKIAKENLFSKNVRYFQGSNKITKSIIYTLKNMPEDFYKYNNGITIVSKKIFVPENWKGHTISFEITGIDIINGQQTVISIFDACKEIKKNNKKIPKNSYVLLKIFSNLKNKQSSNLSMFTNQQKLIKAFELISTQKFNILLQKRLIKQGIFYQPKTGKSSFIKQYKEWPNITLKDVLKYWYIKEEKDVWIKNKINKFTEALISANLYKKDAKYKEISDKFNSMNDIEKSKTFEKIAVTFIILKTYKSKKDVTFKIKQSLDMYSYFLMLNKNKAQSKEFIDFFNKTVSSYSKEFLEIDASKNIANLFKSNKNISKFLFKELLTFFNNLQYQFNI